MSTNPAQPAKASGFAQPMHSHARQITPSDISVGVVVGRTASSFDVFVFGIACALVFPRVFFPFASPADGMFYSFAIFALGFIAQPLGSLFFLPVQRRFGRTTTLTIALFLLGSATVGVAFLPGYESLGYASIAALCILRVGQGFAMGGSWDGLASLLAIKAPRGRRGWYASIPQLGAPIGFIVAAGLFAYLWSSLSHEEFYAWGWRYPFFTAFAVNVVALFARLRLVVSPEYTMEFKQRDLAPALVGGLLRSQGRYVALGAFAPLASYALLNLVTLFTLSWALLYTRQSPTHFLVVQIIGALVAIPCMLLSGRIADRLGRRLTLGLFAILIAVYSGWTAVLLSGNDIESYLFIIIGFALLGFSHAQSSGAVTASFRPEFRYTGAHFSADLSSLLGAGFAPLVALALVAYLGVGYVGLYLLSGAACTLAALWISRKLGGLPNN
ncbi:MFS transporter [Paralcaligenes sp. KSB-10]|uniref:MFS transporter n=1 Tax=Paralcaligenes sp. KSB-10 TaxID=2901142 RepID=UPI001E44CBF1|nr:MFS transporter [Paralcaligenes sp. KSB-10]UHL62704.1 MFS transporter [Paralcaligenes sp. KSB-10]